jgi:hypothetical protein
MCETQKVTNCIITVQFFQENPSKQRAPPWLLGATRECGGNLRGESLVLRLHCHSREFFLRAHTVLYTARQSNCACGNKTNLSYPPSYPFIFRGERSVIRCRTSIYFPTCYQGLLQATYLLLPSFQIGLVKYEVKRTKLSLRLIN